jgi:choline dehydrogenase-like flavoprotein
VAAKLSRSMMKTAAKSRDVLRQVADVAVVGSGPVGLKLALDLADAGMNVLMIESGIDGSDRSAQALSDAVVADPRVHAPMELAVKRAFGGTSNLWGGRAVPLDKIDFAQRPYAAQAQWPIAFSEVEQWYGTACRFLDCGAPGFDDNAFADLESKSNGLKLGRLERWCANPKLRILHGTRALTHPNLRIAFGATVLRVNIDAERRIVRDLLVAIDGALENVTARSYVIAAGGLETTRLLLTSRMTNPGLFGGPNGALGRFYMGHAFGSIADIVFDRPGMDTQFDFLRDGSGRYVRRRFTLDAQTQQQYNVLNMAAWPEPPPLDDPRHCSGILSLAYLALRSPIVGPMLSPEAIRLRKIGTGPLSFRAHARNILSDGISSSKQAAKFLRARYGQRVRLPGFFVPNKAHRYAFHYHGEQLPRADSRIRLSDRTDGLGQPRLAIDLHFGEADAASIVKTHELMAQRLQTSGIGRLEYPMPAEARVSAVLTQASDGFHQIGTARMSTNERDGVVDANARVHGFANLFLAGSAIFPSSGQANPTLTAVALAARLAAHLRRAQMSLPASALASE